MHSELSQRPVVPTFVGREPILDCNLEVQAWEISYRDGLDELDSGNESEFSTAQAFWNTFMELGVENVAPDWKAFLPVSREFLLGDCPEIFPPHRLALVLNASLLEDEEVSSRLRELKSANYQLVLDDFDRSSAGEFSDLIDAVKVDVEGVGSDEAVRIAAKLDGRGVRRIAKNLSSYEEFEACRRCGYEAFQGRFLSRPQVVAGGRILHAGISRTRMLAAINSSDSSIDDLVELIEQDVALSFKLLKYVNSPLVGLRSTVESVRHAVMLLGQRWLRTWTNLALLAYIDGRPQAVFDLAIVRARMCENLGRLSEAERPEVFFTAGLFSTLDALLSRPLDEVLQELPLTDELNGALLRLEGPVGQTLACTLAYEVADWERVNLGALTPEEIRDAYIDSLRWAADLRNERA